MNQDTIPVLRRILDESPQVCPPYVVDYEETIIVTNQSILIEWPRELVDRNCPQYQKLVSNCNDKLAGVKTRLMQNDWRDVLMHPNGRFEGVEEVDPEDDDIGSDALVFLHDRLNEGAAGPIFYHWTNIELVEFFITDPAYALYVAPPEQNLDERMRMLAVFQRDVGPLAVFASQAPKE